MGEEDGLGVLQVGATGHRHPLVGLRLRDECVDDGPVEVAASSEER